jgi:hypothetical protein
MLVPAGKGVNAFSYNERRRFPLAEDEMHQQTLAD